MPNGDKNRTLSPELIDKIARMELTARTAADGLLAGMHRSNAKGFNVEFLEHRPYSPGDDIRHIDWKARAKSGKYFIKLREEERNIQAHIIADASASMDFGAGDSSNKWNRCALLASSVAYLLLKQGDAVGLSLAGGQAPVSRAEHRASRGQLHRLISILAAARPAGAASLAAELAASADLLKRRSFVIVFSDLLEPPEPVMESLRALRGRGNDATIFHILSPEETDFPFAKAAKFIDPESGAFISADPSAVRAAYIKALSSFTRGYREFCARMDIDYVSAPTSASPEETLLKYLESRGRRAGR
ncbi:MAG TPA: DUF58 domain-containing protein [bacterium]|nr:DUF58 domain-containing protein [bacterium]